MNLNKRPIVKAMPTRQLPPEAENLFIEPNPEPAALSAIFIQTSLQLK